MIKVRSKKYNIPNQYWSSKSLYVSGQQLIFSKDYIGEFLRAIEIQCNGKK